MASRLWRLGSLVFGFDAQSLLEPRMPLDPTVFATMQANVAKLEQLSSAKDAEITQLKAAALTSDQEAAVHDLASRLDRLANPTVPATPAS